MYTCALNIPEATLVNFVISVWACAIATCDFCVISENYDGSAKEKQDSYSVATMSALEGYARLECSIQ